MRTLRELLLAVRDAALAALADEEGGGDAGEGEGEGEGEGGREGEGR